MHTYEMIYKLHIILNSLKGMAAGHSTSIPNQMIVEKENKVYKLTLEELGEGKVEDYMDTLQKG